MSDFIDHFASILTVIGRIEELKLVSPYEASQAYRFLEFAFQMESDERGLDFMSLVVTKEACKNVAVGILSPLIYMKVRNDHEDSSITPKDIHSKLMTLSPNNVKRKRGDPDANNGWPKIWNIGLNANEWGAFGKVYSHYKKIQGEIEQFCKVNLGSLDFKEAIEDPLQKLFNEFGQIPVMKAFEILHWAILDKVRVAYMTTFVKDGYIFNKEGYQHILDDARNDTKLSLSMWLRFEDDRLSKK